MKFLVVILVALLAVVSAFAPISSVNGAVRTRGSVLMDGKTRVLRDRIKTVKNTRRITEAMRLVANCTPGG